MGVGRGSPLEPVGTLEEMCTQLWTVEDDGDGDDGGERLRQRQGQQQHHL